MEKLVVEEICRKYDKREALIVLMMKYQTNEGYTLEEAKNLIEIFYSEKSMQ